MNTLITQDRLNEITRLAATVPYGIFAEVGVYKGGSLKVLADNFQNNLILGFDTFEGLPKEHWNENEVHKPNEFNDTSIESVRSFVNNPNVALFKGLFPGSAPFAKDFTFSFVHIDVDFYEATKECLQFFLPRMNKGGVIVLDDYEWPNCPGVKQATEYLKINSAKTNAGYQAYIQF